VPVETTRAADAALCDGQSSGREMTGAVWSGRWHDLELSMLDGRST